MEGTARTEGRGEGSERKIVRKSWMQLAVWAGIGGGGGERGGGVDALAGLHVSREG